MVIQIFVLHFCPVMLNHVLIVLHNQCLISACPMRGLQFSSKRCEIGDNLFCFIFLGGDHLCNNGEEPAEYACLETAELDSN